MMIEAAMMTRSIVSRRIWEKLEAGRRRGRGSEAAVTWRGKRGCGSENPAVMYAHADPHVSRPHRAGGVPGRHDGPWHLCRPEAEERDRLLRRRAFHALVGGALLHRGLG